MELDVRGIPVKLITNRTGSYLTGDELADATMQYGLALARMRDLDVVDIPFVSPTGVVLRVQLTIGWGADTAVTSTLNRHEELIEIDTELRMRASADALTTVRGHPFTEEELTALQWEFVGLADHI